ncbi:MAG: DUF4065 domain-containing protein [Calditrichaeota bacterium]|nr:DUF4065 domain-containing protein [Calditrichota bacterium]
MENKKVDILDLSRFLITYCKNNEIELNQLKLQKLLYYIQAWHLVYFNNDLIFDDVPEAWVNGPVYRKVYDVYKPSVYRDLTKSDKVEELTTIDLNDEQIKFLESIMDHYGLMPHEKLVFLTHAEKPWNQAREGLSIFEYSNEKITHESMKSYYSSLIA